MAISRALKSEILRKHETSDRTLKRAVQQLVHEHGPMSGDEARGVIAAEARIRLSDFGWTNEEEERIRHLRRDGAVSRYTKGSPAPRGDAAEPSSSNARATDDSVARSPTRREIFDARGFHPTVRERSRTAFVNRMNDTAVEKAMKSVNNRVKRLVGSGGDGAALMTFAFSPNSPRLQMSQLTTRSETDEQQGIMRIAEGAMIGLRNPRAHDDEWQPDQVDEYALDALAVASFLHRTIDRCDDFSVSADASRASST